MNDAPVDLHPAPLSDLADMGAQSSAASAAETSAPPAVRLSVDVRSAALGVLAVLAIVVTLKWAKVVLIPIALAAFLSYSLRPVVVGLRRHARIRESIGAGLALMVAVGVVAGGTAALESQATRLLDSMPHATKKLERFLHRSALDNTGAVQKLLAAADGLERIAAGPASTSVRASESESLAAEPLKLRSYLWAGTEAMFSGLFQAILVLALAYFLLISSQSLKRKLVKVSGNTISTKKITVRILDDIDSQIQRYVVIQVGTSALVGLGTGFAFALIGLENAMFWGVAAGVLHLIPYVGSGLVVIASTLFAWLQFDTINGALLVASSALGVAGIVGFGIVPWLTEKVGRINAVATLMSLMIWEWLWGIPGLLLGVPIMMALMAVCEHVENLNPVAELLSGDAPPAT
ncbi:MAG: AI-2E family transporter [Panacagrimonas sp.]